MDRLYKVVANQLSAYLSANDLHEPLQSAYKKLHSCETALIHVQNNILQQIDNRSGVALVLLDLSAAFDTVDHSILLNRLFSKFGVCGKALQWFKSYLCGRSQFVSVNGCSSSPPHIRFYCHALCVSHFCTHFNTCKANWGQLSSLLYL